jgi:hypothetical protein
MTLKNPMRAGYILCVRDIARIIADAATGEFENIIIGQLNHILRSSQI